MRTRQLALVATALAAAACGTRQSAEQRTAASVEPTTILCGEAACPELSLPGACAFAAGSLELSPPPAFLEAMFLDPAAGVTTATVDGTTFTVTLGEDLKTFDWAATAGVDLVVAQGEWGAYAYRYDPEATADTALGAFSGRPVTAVTFCWDVESSPGCTYTQGYWKNHSRQGPARYDAGWHGIGDLEEETPFFLSGHTWLEVFRTPPRGDAYYQLAHQYMAAKLNVLSGASGDALGDALATAAGFLGANPPGATLTMAQRAQFRALASLLDQFNSGEVGPGHCP